MDLPEKLWVSSINLFKVMTAKSELKIVEKCVKEINK